MPARNRDEYTLPARRRQAAGLTIIHLKKAGPPAFKVLPLVRSLAGTPIVGVYAHTHYCLWITRPQILGLVAQYDASANPETPAGCCQNRGRLLQ
jgi:hypothetical protein